MSAHFNIFHNCLPEVIMERERVVYVGINVALRGVPMERGVQLGLGEGPVKWVQCPNPAGSIGPASGTLAHTCALLCAFCSQLYSRELRGIRILICAIFPSHCGISEQSKYPSLIDTG